MLTEMTYQEVLMAESRREGSPAVKEAEKPIEANQAAAGAERQLERAGQATQQQFERLSEIGREGMRQAADTLTAGAGEAAHSNAAMVECAQEITSAWSRYAENVMRQTSEASRALLRARTFSEMLEVQAKLLRDNMQAFLDQSVTIAEAASRMAARPFEALREVNSDQVRR
jgi:hypothetical protein